MKQTILATTAILLSGLALASTAFADHHGHDHGNVETYKIDTVHSSVEFSIRHFVARTTGRFSDFEGTLTINRDDLTKSSVEASIKIPSVNTDSERRDAHLQEDEYFHAGEFPLMTFKSTKWVEAEGENKFKVTGDLSMRGVTKEVVLDVELLGFGQGMGDNFLSGWVAKTTLDRTDWGVNAGQPAVGKTVDVTINIEAIRQ